MQVSTTRFGLVNIEPEDILRFPGGLLGLGDCHDWVLLADAENAALAWLQSTSLPDLALAVVHPRQFVPQYQLRVGRRDLEPLALTSLADAEVLAVVGEQDGELTLNLKAPLLINLPGRLGRQVIVEGDAAVNHAITRRVAAPHTLSLTNSLPIPAVTGLKRVA